MLRRAAEKRVHSQVDPPEEISVEDAKSLIHELRVHQIELEMQNEELRQAHAQIEESRERYADLYDFAPVGYLALNDKGHVVEANLAAAAQLGTERTSLIETIFPLYVNPKDRQQARLHIVTVFKTRGRQTCELRLKPKGGEEFYARMESVFIENTNGEGRCRTSIIDISYARRAEEALHRAHDELEARVRERTAELTEANERLLQEITERKRAEEALFESEERFRVMANSIPQLAWIAEADGYINWYNQRWYDYTGTKPEQMQGWGWQSVHNPETLPSVLERWKNSITTGKPFDMVFPLRGADGSFREFLTRVMPVKDANGDVIRWCGTNTDISEHKQMEENQSRLAAIVESSDDAIIGKTLDGVITSWNRGAEEMYGYTVEEVLGQSMSILIPNNRPYEEPAILQRVGGGEDVQQYDTLRRRKDGKNIHVSLAISPIRGTSGKIIGASTIARDITEHKRLEEELRKSRDELELRVRERTAQLEKVNHELLIEIQERRRADEAVRSSEREFRLLAEAMPQIVWITRPDGWNIYFNRRWLDYTGQTLEESYGHGWNKPFHPDDQERAWDAWQNATKNGAVYDLECRLRRADGVYGWWLIRGVPVLDERGAILKWFGTCTDIDELKRMEESLHKSLIELELSIQARTATIARLELVNAELQEFAFIASHDLQEPLRKIQTFCDMALKRCAPVLDATGKDYLDRVVNSANRMRQLLRDLLDFSRVATRTEPFKKIDLVKIAMEAADVFEASVKETGCQIEVENIPAVEADESQMLRLFQNLIGNAMKFRSETPHIRVYGKLDGKRICEIFVEDNGIGFDQQFAELIFKPFQRLHGRNEYDGTGMGLAICRKIVERHGGSIRAESEPGERLDVHNQTACKTRPV